MLKSARLLAVLLLALAPLGCEPDGAPTTGDDQNVTESTGRFETFKAEDGKYYFQLLASNGERILESQSYSSSSAMKKGITSVKKNGVDDAHFEVTQTDSGEFYFNLVADNGQVIGTSETYASEANADRGVDAVIAALKSPSTLAAEAGGIRFETFKGSDSKTYFRLRAKNGKVVLQSQGYSSKSAADSGIASVKKNGLDASLYELVGGDNGQYGFHLKATNGKIIGRGEMYASKSGAIRGADTVRDLLRELAGAGAPADAEIQKEIEAAAEGLYYTSESDYPFAFVSSAGQKGAPVDEATVRAAFASLVDADDAADKPMSTLYGMESTWQTWKDQAHNCADPNDPDALPGCMKMRNLESVLESNLTDIKVFYFGAKGAAGNVQGIGVSVFIVGRTPAGTLAGVRTLAIWT
ncbi:MAG: DUF1508 domain-containing protein [Polyangiaceae bacterium]